VKKGKERSWRKKGYSPKRGLFLLQAKPSPLLRRRLGGEENERVLLFLLSGGEENPPQKKKKRGGGRRILLSFGFLTNAEERKKKRGRPSLLFLGGKKKGEKEKGFEVQLSLPGKGGISIFLTFGKGKKREKKKNRDRLASLPALKEEGRGGGLSGDNLEKPERKGVEGKKGGKNR